MINEKTYSIFTPLAINCDILNINYLNTNDINVCNYVINQLSYCPPPIFKLGDKISQELLLQKSIERMNLFGTEVHSKITSLIPSIAIYRNNHNRNFSTLIYYATDPFSSNEIAATAKVSRYNIPKTLYESDITIIGHEHCHSLKDTSYDEYINIYTLGEAIPIFYELIANEPNNDIKKRILQSRLFYLNTNKREFISATKIIAKHKEINLQNNRTVYNYIQSRTGCYLNSFYYAIILYHLYKQNPQKILSLISKVLCQYTTTYNILQELDIYGNIQGEIFETELKELKRILKR